MKGAILTIGVYSLLIWLALCLLNAQATVTCLDGACTDGPDPAPEISSYISYYPAPIEQGIKISIALSEMGYAPQDFEVAGTDGYYRFEVEEIQLPVLNAEKVALHGALFALWGMLDQIEDISFFLGMHGYNVTKDGLVTLSNGDRWQIIIGPGEVIRLEVDWDE